MDIPRQFCKEVACKMGCSDSRQRYSNIATTIPLQKWLNLLICATRLALVNKPLREIRPKDLWVRTWSHRYDSKWLRLAHVILISRSRLRLTYRECLPGAITPQEPFSPVARQHAKSSMLTGILYLAIRSKWHCQSHTFQRWSLFTVSSADLSVLGNLKRPTTERVRSRSGPFSDSPISGDGQAKSGQAASSLMPSIHSRWPRPGQALRASSDAVFLGALFWITSKRLSASTIQGKHMYGLIFTFSNGRFTRQLR
jgi:hypothetical protein